MPTLNPSSFQCAIRSPCLTLDTFLFASEMETSPRQSSAQARYALSLGLQRISCDSLEKAWVVFGMPAPGDTERSIDRIAQGVVPRDSVVTSEAGDQA